MARLIAEMTMSLDGFIAFPDDTVGGLFDWYTKGTEEVRTAREDMTWHVNPASAGHVRSTMSNAGSLLVGRRIFDITDGWGGRHPIGCPVVVLSHSVPDGWPRDDAPFTFITSSFQDAVTAAVELAGGKDVGLAGPDIIRQALDAGQLEEVRINLAPWILGNGIRFFDHLATAPIKLEQTKVIEGDGVTHLYYKVLPE